MAGEGETGWGWDRGQGAGLQIALEKPFFWQRRPPQPVCVAAGWAAARGST